MPKLTDRLPKYCKHKASGQATVKLGGRVYYLGRHGSRSSKAEYKRLVGEWLTRDRTAPSTAGRDDLTVVELLARYLPFARRHYRKHGHPTGEIENIKYAIRPLRALYGRRLASDFGPLALKALQTHMIRQNLARGTINSRIGIIRRIFRWAVSEQLCPPAVILGLNSVMGLQAGRTSARETRPVQPVPDSIVEATIRHLPPHVADMVRLQRLLACRPAEICAMRPIDVDCSSEVWVYRPESHKTEHYQQARLIFVGPKAQAILRPYLLRDSLAQCFSPSESERKRLADLRARRKTSVQPSQMNRRKRRPKRKPGMWYRVTEYRRAVTRACDSAFPPPSDLAEDQRKAWRQAHRWHPSQLRHTAGTSIRKQFGIEAARILLGHSKVSTTEIYAARDLQTAADVARKIG